MKEIIEREDIKWVIYTDSLSSKLAIENKRENHHNQGKQLTLCKVPAHIEVKGNKEADKTEKQAIDITGMTTTRASYSDYYLTIRRARNSEWQR